MKSFSWVAIAIVAVAIWLRAEAAVAQPVSQAACNCVSGANSTTGITAVPFTGISAPGPGLRVYGTGLQCSNSSGTGALVTLNDTANNGNGSNFFIPATGLAGSLFSPSPLTFPINTAPTFTVSSSISTMYCNLQGYVSR